MHGARPPAGHCPQGLSDGSAHASSVRVILLCPYCRRCAVKFYCGWLCCDSAIRCFLHDRAQSHEPQIIKSKDADRVSLLQIHFETVESGIQCTYMNADAMITTVAPAAWAWTRRGERTGHMRASSSKRSRSLNEMFALLFGTLICWTDACPPPEAQLSIRIAVRAPRATKSSMSLHRSSGVSAILSSPPSSSLVVDINVCCKQAFQSFATAGIWSD